LWLWQTALTDNVTDTCCKKNKCSPTLYQVEKLAEHNMYAIHRTGVTRLQFLARYPVSHQRTFKIQFLLKKFKRDDGLTINTSRN
jgi:hypothetical protein